MSNKEFNKAVREKLYTFNEEVDQSDLLWDSISSSLDAKALARERFIIRAKRVAFTIGSIAAILIVALYIPKAPNSTKPHTEIAQSDLTQENCFQPKIQPNELNQNNTVAVLTKAKTVIKKTSLKTIQAKINVSGAECVAEVGDYKNSDAAGATATTDATSTVDVIIAVDSTSAAVDSEKETTTTASSKEQTINEAIDNLQKSYYALSTTALDNNADFNGGATGSERIDFKVASNVGSSMNNGTSLHGGSMFAAGSGANLKLIEQVSETKYLMPLGFGFQVKVELNNLLSLGAGVNYTLLKSRYDGLINKQLNTVKQSLHYLGLPVNLYFNLLNKNQLSCYANVGGTVEKGLSVVYNMSNYESNTHIKEAIEGVEYSINGGMGLEYRFTNAIGIYIEPNFIYYINSKIENSIKTNQPLQFRTEVGFRFTL